MRRPARIEAMAAYHKQTSAFGTLLFLLPFDGRRADLLLERDKIRKPSHVERKVPDAAVSCPAIGEVAVACDDMSFSQALPSPSSHPVISTVGIGRHSRSNASELVPIG